MQILLDEYVKKGITVGDFFSVILQAANAIIQAQSEGIQIVIDTQCIYVIDGKMRFIKKEEDSIYEMNHMKDFFRELAFDAIFLSGEDCSRITEFLKFLDDENACRDLKAVCLFCASRQNIPTMNIHDEDSRADAQPIPQENARPIQQSLQQMNAQPMQQQPMQQMNTQPAQQQPIQQQPLQQMNAQPVQQRPIQQPMQQMNAHPIQQPIQRRPMQQPYVSIDEEENDETGVLEGGYWDKLERQYNAAPMNPNNYAEDVEDDEDGGETGVLDPSYWNSVMRNTPQSNGRLREPVNSFTVKLINKKTGQANVINQNEFWVGKEGVDLIIEKDVISRRHASIVVRDRHVFIIDNKSTNKTYVDGKAIPPKASVEVFNGTKVKFANEEFEIQITQ